MKLRILCLVLACTASVLGQGLREKLDPARGEREGMALTAELLARVPAANYTNSGVLEIKQRRAAPIEIPVRFTVLVAGDRWLSRYEALGAGVKDGAATLTIFHQPGKPNHYVRSASEEEEHSAPLTAATVATLKFAGSDFWACDLGLDFLQWPRQRLLMKDMRSGQSCNVLESSRTNAPAGGYARVVSWLDIDTGGIVYAESFDADNKRVKEFAPKAFKKVDGEWQLEEMRIEDLKGNSKSTIRFNVGKE